MLAFDLGDERLEDRRGLVLRLHRHTPCMVGVVTSEADSVTMSVDRCGGDWTHQVGVDSLECVC